ncbi:MAG: DUF692 family protein [Deltaproteobacteria bacterium]|nr:DUF692 family protein [Deltaproteobacteria bacterium]
MVFADRVAGLPRLGIGVSTEYGAARSPGSLDVLALARSHPQFASFLEVGVEVGKGVDDDARRWVAEGRPTTYHFLDVNLDDDSDFDDDDWTAEVLAGTALLRPAWVCGDAGLWHFGRRERGHMLLLPPVLVDDAATAFAAGVERLRALTGCEVLPENPPGTAFVGDLHLLDFFARVCERADCGMLLDVAHLAMFQRATGRAPLQDLDFPWERVIEVHVAGTSERAVDGFVVVDDSHTAAVSADTWTLFEHVVARATNLKAVVFECERNSNVDVVAGFERIARTWAP